ncbi:MAG: hypothetical protein IJJ01_09025 [Firmicutes bacterium]|nr:hypothetical protein [Bacillota bacterium]
MKRIIIPLLIGAIMILVVGCGGKAITLPFVIGDSYDTAQEYIYENGEYYHDNSWLFDRYFNECQGWFDYLGTGEPQLVVIYDEGSPSVDNKIVTKIEMQMQASQGEQAASTLAQVYGIDTDDANMDEADGVLSMESEDVTISIKDGGTFGYNAAYYAGEGCVIIVIEEK